jgi:hypothetical protein
MSELPLTVLVQHELVRYRDTDDDKTYVLATNEVFVRIVVVVVDGVSRTGLVRVALVTYSELPVGERGKGNQLARNRWTYWANTHSLACCFASAEVSSLARTDWKLNANQCRLRVGVRDASHSPSFGMSGRHLVSSLLLGTGSLGSAIGCLLGTASHIYVATMRGVGLLGLERLDAI